MSPDMVPPIKKEISEGGESNISGKGLALKMAGPCAPPEVLHEHRARSKPHHTQLGVAPKPKSNQT